MIRRLLAVALVLLVALVAWQMHAADVHERRSEFEAGDPLVAGLRGQAPEPGSGPTPLVGPVVAEPLRPIRGTVRTCAGEVLTDATVTWARELPGGDFEVVVEVRTDAKGAYMLTPPEPEGTLRAAAAGRVAVERTAPAGSSQHFRLPLGGRLVGRVSSAVDGGPVPDALVVVLDRESALEGVGVAARTRSDAGGGYVLEGVPLGEVRVVVVPRAQQAALVEAVVDLPATTRLDVLVPAGRTLTGRVTLDGEPVAGAPVEMWGALYAVGPETRRATTTDAQGRYTLRGLGLDSQSLLVRVPEPIWLVPAHADARCDLALRTLWTVRGHVRRAGRPVPGAHVGPDLRPSPVRLRTTTDDEGSFALRFLGTGRRPARASFRLLAAAAHYETAASPELTVEEGTVLEDVAIDLAGARLVTGSVRDADGAPTSSVHLTVTGSGPYEGARRLPVPLDPGGRYELRWRAPELSLEASLDGHVFQRVDLALEDGEARVVDFVVPAGVIRGRVLDPTSRPVPGARVTWRAHDVRLHAWNRRGQAQTFSGPDGSFTIRGLRPGRYDLWGWRAPFEIVTRAWVRDGERSAELVLRPRPAAPAIRGRVQRADGSPVPVFRFELARHGWYAYGNDAEGRFTYRTPSTGTYTCRVLLPDGTATEGEVELVEGETRDLTITVGD